MVQADKELRVDKNSPDSELLSLIQSYVNLVNRCSYGDKGS